MKETYLMDKETGELVPALRTIHEWSQTHAWNDPWTRRYEETDIEIDGTDIGLPDFAGAVAV